MLSVTWVTAGPRLNACPCFGGSASADVCDRARLGAGGGRAGRDAGAEGELRCPPSHPPAPSAAEPASDNSRPRPRAPRLRATSLLALAQVGRELPVERAFDSRTARP